MKADMFTTPSRSVSSRPLLQFLDVFLLSGAAQTPLLTASSMNLLFEERLHSMMDFLPHGMM